MSSLKGSSCRVQLQRHVLHVFEICEVVCLALVIKMSFVARFLIDSVARFELATR